MDKVKRFARRSSVSAESSPATRNDDPAPMSTVPTTNTNAHAKNLSFSQPNDEGLNKDGRASNSESTEEGMQRLSLDDAQVKGGLGSKLSSSIVDKSQQDHKTLAPVLHERIIHHETELITRQREVERHIHHVQHHVQPLVEEVHQPEQHYHQTEPVSYEYEEQANTAEDKAFFASLHKQRSSETHICEERKVIENGETITTTIHYHVHNIIQPVIYRDRPTMCVKGCTKASEVKSIMSLLKVHHSDVDESNSGRPITTNHRAGQEEVVQEGGGGVVGSAPTSKASRRAEQVQQAQMGLAR